MITTWDDPQDVSELSRREKKSRKAMLKLGMKAVVGVSRVTIKKTKNVCSYTNTKPLFFVVVVDLSSQLQAQAAQRFRMPDMGSVMEKPDSDAAAAPAPADEEEIDETGVEPRDIDLVMTQAGVSRSKAVKALKVRDGDIVSAIMELTS
ncbi:hypothetical protein R6Q57_029837 [Mikania cordata]